LSPLSFFSFACRQNGSHQPNFLLVTKSTLIIVIVNILSIADYCFCRPILLSPLAWSSLIPSNTIIHLFDRRRLCFRHHCRQLLLCWYRHRDGLGTHLALTNFDHHTISIFVAKT
jgi:hypothetical protein